MRRTKDLGRWKLSRPVLLGSVLLVNLLGLAVSQSAQSTNSGNQLSTDGAATPVPPRLDDRALTTSGELVGATICLSCHPQYETQRTSHMALTGRAVDGTTLHDWFSPVHLAQPVVWSDPRGEAPQYKVEDGGVRLTHRLSADVPVDAMFGSGTHGVTPVSAEANGIIRELRLSYSDVLGSWFTTPGAEDDSDILGILKSSEESRDCLECHATGLAFADGLLDAEQSVLGVQCERCHGPGSRHVEAVKRGDGERDESILNPGHFNASEQLRFCGQCHRTPSDMEPLEHLQHRPSLARHAGASLMMSRCYRESDPEKTITCLDCHNPHEDISPGADYRPACLRCHSEPASRHQYELVDERSDCVGCHMPAQTKGFYGMSFADHWIRVPSETGTQGSQSEAETLAYLEVQYRNAIESVVERPEKSGNLRVYLAEVLLGQGDESSALTWLERAMERTPSPTQRLKAAAIWRQAGHIDKAVQVLEATAEIVPNTPQVFFDLGDAYRLTGDQRQAAEAFRRVIALNPKVATAHAHLGRSELALGDLDQARNALAAALELAPEDPYALTAMAELNLAGGDVASSSTQLEAVLDRYPNYLPALLTSGWLHAAFDDASIRNPGLALRHAERAAARTGYQNPLVLDCLAAAQAAGGDFDSAVLAIDKAIGIVSGMSTPESQLLSGLQQRLTLYRAKTPYVGPRPR